MNTRFLPQPNGDVYDSWGRFCIARDLWESRKAEGRSASAPHRFVIGGRVDEAMQDDEYHRLWATCRRCGEVLKVFHGVAAGDLNKSGWCIRRRLGFRRLGRGEGA